MPGRAPAIWEWAHVQAAWAAGAPAFPGCVLSYHSQQLLPHLLLLGTQGSCGLKKAVPGASVVVWE